MNRGETLAVTAAVLVLLGSAAVAAPVASPTAYGPAIPEIPSLPEASATDLDSLVAAMMSEHPFRLTRRSAVPQPAVSGAEPELGQPFFRLLGTAGPPWTAVIVGFDTPEAVVLAIGDERDGFRVREIAPGCAVLVAADGLETTLRFEDGR